METVGIIPARGGSKGIPRKNLRLLAGQPLIAHTIHAAQNSRLSAIVVTTDDAEIAEIASTMGCDLVMRPPKLADDTTPMLPVLVHALETLHQRKQNFDAMVLLQPTAPLRTSTDIDACLTLLATSGADSVVSVTLISGHYHPDWQFVLNPDNETLCLYNGNSWDQLATRRQILSHTYTRNGAIYACRPELILKAQSLYGEVVHAYVMPEERSINIESELDLILAEVIMNTIGTGTSL